MLARDIDGRTVFGTRDLVEAEDCAWQEGLMSVTMF